MAENILHITRKQYRGFAEITKSVAGMALNLSSFSRMGNAWGIYSPWALLTCIDATQDKPKFDEISFITIAKSININKFRVTKRPELDWSKLEDNEIYPFVIWHEIGHRLDNFEHFEVMRLSDLQLRDECHRKIVFANEVLADRYAWERIRPGEPIPLSDHSQAMQEKVSEALDLLNMHIPRKTRNTRKLKSGNYKYVPDYMLATPERAAFVGKHVSKSLLHDRVAFYKDHQEKYGRPLF